MRRNATAVIAFALILAMRSVQAGPITYTETVVGSGSLGGTDFTSELITLTVTADTAAITNPDPGFFTVPGLTAMVSVATVGSGTFTGSTNVFDNQGAQVAGIESGTGRPDILDIANSVFATYDLSTPIGPVTGTPSGNPGTSFATSAGAFIITGTADTGTFQAGSAVPEPSSLWMAGTAAVAGLGLWSRRRNRR
jgi:hypothetical protein